MLDIKLFNSIDRKLDSVTVDGSGVVGIYACGPTVYNLAHIGNFRAYVFVDCLRRTLTAGGYKTKLVVNITDVGHLTGESNDDGEDKLVATARKEHKSAWEVASFYTDAFLTDLKRLNIITPDVLPRATAHIQDQIDLIEQIETKGFTYLTPEGLYFDTAKLPSYGSLGRLKLSSQKQGTRQTIKTDKRNPADFALWRLSTPGEKRDMEWKSPWGIGYPGWHIECSAMSTKYLGQPFSIHTGGIDHLTVHHENEIAQTLAATGKQLAKIFVHNEFLLVDGHKMSKSLGNIVTLQDFIDKGFEPRAFRLLCLQTHYRDKLNFTWQSLESAQKTIHNIDRITQGEGEPDIPTKQNLLNYLSNDLATPKVLAGLFDSGNAWLWREFSDILGLEFSQPKKLTLTSHQKQLIEQRELLRSQKKFKEADTIRDLLIEQGVIIEDQSFGI